jgi:hypothetical protein
MATKNGLWKNYYTGRDGNPLHLRNGWMFNEQSGELMQIKEHS